MLGGILCEMNFAKNWTTLRVQGNESTKENALKMAKKNQ
jgi:hypothetical protein